MGPFLLLPLRPRTDRWHQTRLRTLTHPARCSTLPSRTDHASGHNCSTTSQFLSPGLSHLSLPYLVAAPREVRQSIMYLNTSVSLDESTAGLTPEQLDNIIESVQQQKKKLEDDIAKYIREKQNELRAFGQKVCSVR